MSHSDSTIPSPSPMVVDPRITRSLGADYEALKNDLEQANGFAGDLQKELAMNKNDAAHFKQLFEKTREDLEKMQTGILALRQERHAFANEVMKTRAFEMRLTLVTQERDTLLGTIAELKKRAAEASDFLQKRDAQIADLTMQVMLLKNTFRQAQERRSAEIAAKNFEADFIERLGT